MDPLSAPRVVGLRSRLWLCTAVVASAGLLTARAAVSAPPPPHGALLPLSGRGFCLGRYCAPLRGFGSASPGAQYGNDVRLELSSDGRRIFAIGGSSRSVAVLARNPRTGAVRQIPGRAGCVTSRRLRGCATLPALAQADEITVSPDGRALGLISYSAGGRLVFDRNPQTGALRRMGTTQHCVAALDGPCVAARGVASRNGAIHLSPNRLLVFGTGVPSGGAVAILTRTSARGRWHQPRGASGCANAQGSSGCSTDRCLPAGAILVTLSADGHEVYVTQGGFVDLEETSEGSLATLRLQNDGSLVPLGCVGTGSDALAGFSPQWISPLPGTRALLVLQVRASRSDGIAWERMFAAVPGPSGALRTPRQISPTLSDEPTPVSLSPDGHTLYVLDSDVGGNADVYHVSATAVRAFADAWFQPYTALDYPYGANDLLRSPDGRFVYLTAGSIYPEQDGHAPQLRVYRVAP
jgi:hypothetical protein